MYYTCITTILDFFPDIISLQRVFHLGVGRSQIEWKLKVKNSNFSFPWAKIGQNNHSNPYIESTTALSDYLWSVCPEVFSRTVAVVDTKRGYVGMCNGRSAQQESGATSSKSLYYYNVK